MDFIFCKLKKGKKHGFHFLRACKTSQNMDFIFCKLKKAQKPQKTWISVLFLQACKTSKNMDFIFYEQTKPEKTWISSFASLQNFKKHGFHLLQA